MTLSASKYSFQNLYVFAKNTKSTIKNALKSERKKKVSSLKKRYHQGPEKKMALNKERYYRDPESRRQY